MCDKPGHLASNCPNKSSNNDSGGQTNGTGSGPPKVKNSNWRRNKPEDGNSTNMNKEVKDYTWCKKCNYWTTGEGKHTTEAHRSKITDDTTNERSTESGNSTGVSGALASQGRSSSSDDSQFVGSGLTLIGNICEKVVENTVDSNLGVYGTPKPYNFNEVYLEYSKDTVGNHEMKM